MVHLQPDPDRLNPVHPHLELQKIDTRLIVRQTTGLPSGALQDLAAPKKSLPRR
jgi:hypothetical protein